MPTPSSGIESSNQTPQDQNDHHHKGIPSASPPPMPIKSKSTSNLPTLTDTKPTLFHDSDVMSSVTTPIHQAQLHRSHDLIDLGQEETNIPDPIAAASHQPQSVHSLPPLPREESYIPIGQIILRYLERWILGLIERHRNGPYFYPIAITVVVVVVVLVLTLVFTGNFNALMRILQHLICELIQQFKPSSTIQFCM
ncbi:hypothetical protein CORT_0D06930 [Candida orthopsilosis Co 90-125]|uniref:Uncharacterized protein n=1 Tax=Candida orthopsilosis (strain 90-125) TaxID=1136231 RepID=H8X5R8_CANO9|nr:hypothetical protein CORT_0D06930 [Candida orthopsilosis Co 90-125]CCG23526.1 hypothetical protein CORT_0D06930 [Candida orthopsilosis Co 90-125]